MRVGVQEDIMETLPEEIQNEILDWAACYPLPVILNKITIQWWLKEEINLQSELLREEKSDERRERIQYIRLLSHTLESITREAGSP